MLPIEVLAGNLLRAIEASPDRAAATLAARKILAKVFVEPATRQDVVDDPAAALLEARRREAARRGGLL